MNRAVFLDRDGTLIKDAHYLKDPAKVEVIEGVGEALARIRKAGFLLFLHTNQSGIARGYYDWDDVRACNLKMLKLLQLPENFFDEICIAPEWPAKEGGYRKPSNRFERETIDKRDLEPSECWMVGDKWIDAETGLLAGMRAALVKTGKPIDDDTRSKTIDSNVPIHSDLLEFVERELRLQE
jgi:D-glycero-D-manno-heptose 1,7-bisphosphate phosphatase